MKKFVLLILTIIFTASFCLAEVFDLEKEGKYQKKVMQIGFRILNENQIEKRMTFYYAAKQSVNAATYLKSKQIVVYKGIIPFMDTDDEIAAILSHEIAHGIEAHKGFWNRIAIRRASKTFEYDADRTGIDLMVNAGYNPLAMIIILNKIAEEPNWFERSSSHPDGSERLISAYSYIYAKYPEFLIENKYKNNIYYQNFLLTTKAQRKALKDQYVNISNKTK